MEMETVNTLPFLVVLVTKRGQHYSLRFYTKSTHTGHYLHLKADHRLHVKGGVVHLVNQDYVSRKTWFHRRNLRTVLDWYSHHLIVINKLLKNGHPDGTLFGMIVISCQSISEKFQQIGNYFNIRTVWMKSFSFVHFSSYLSLCFTTWLYFDFTIFPSSPFF